MNICTFFKTIFKAILNLNVTHSQRLYIDVSPIIQCDKNNLNTHDTAFTEFLSSSVNGHQSNTNFVVGSLFEKLDDNLNQR